MSFDPHELLFRLKQSTFRARFHLDLQSRAYLQEKGLDTVMAHAADFIRDRLAPAHPLNDGKLTPMRGHPVFIAQHATGSCCRSCLQKWQHMSKNQPLTEDQQATIIAVIRAWIEQDTQGNVPDSPAQGSLF